MEISEAVKKYTEKGWVIHPLSNPKDDKQSPGKRPLLREWQHLTQTPSDIDSYVKKGCNIGLVCGKVSNLTVIDFDSDIFINELTRGIEFKTLGSYRTNRRGHLYFKYNPKLVAQKHHNLDIEILSDGNNAVLPPSIHHTGDVYRWMDESAEPIEMPLKLIENLLKLFETEQKLASCVAQCRPCFRKYWQDDKKVRHGSTARLFVGAFCSELYNKGAGLDEIKLFARIIYREGYDEKRTVIEYNGWTQKGFHPWTCETLKEQCNGFINCEACPLKNKERKEQFPERDLKELMSQQEKEHERKLEVNLPSDHFVIEYIKWLSSISDGFVDYQIASALWMLSALTSGRAILKLKQETVKTNLWFVLIGRSTTSRKSTIVNKTRQIYETATDSILPNEDYSIEGYLETLASCPIMNNVRDEAAGLMAKYHKKYNEGIFELECALYDGQNVKKTLAGGKQKDVKTFEVRNPFITKLYATTSDNFARYMTVDDFTCGYGYRLLYCSPNYKKRRKELELETAEDVEAWGRVMTRVKTLNQFFKGLPRDIEFTIDSNAMQYYNNVITSLENKSEDINNEIFSSIVGRAQVHILKIAMLLELGKNVLSTKVQLDTMQEACRMVTEYFIPSIMELIDRLQEDVKNNQIEKIISVMRRLGGVGAHTKILHDAKLKSKDFADCINTMIEARTIEGFRDKATKVTYYRLLNHNNDLKISPNLPNLFTPYISQVVKEKEILETSNKLEELSTTTRARGTGESSQHSYRDMEIREISEISKISQHAVTETKTSQTTELMRNLEIAKAQYESVKGVINSINIIDFSMWFCSTFKPLYTDTSGNIIEYTPSMVKQIASKVLKIS